jgi:hypothetical protein
VAINQEAQGDGRFIKQVNAINSEAPKWFNFSPFFATAVE